MSYSIDKNSNELVISGWENGIQHSPYLGIANMRNVNASYMPGVAYVNYKRQAATLSGTTFEWIALNSVNVSNNTGWSFNGAPTVLSMANPVQGCTSPAGLNYILDTAGNVWKQSAVNSSTFALLASGAGRITNGSGGIAYFNNFLLVFGNGVIESCGDGTGDAGITSANWNLVSSFNTNPFQIPTGNVTNLSFTGSVSAGATSATISTYTTPSGTSESGNWILASGTYAVIDPTGAVILTTFTNNTATANFISPIVIGFSGTVNVHLLNPSVTLYRPYVSKVDGNLYFSNGRYVGRILAENTNTSYNPGTSASFVVDYGTFSVLDPNDSVVDMTDLNSTLIVAGQTKIYTWDYVSPSTTAPVPIGEQIVRLLNLMNNVYVFTNQKGNIYISNGSYAQFLMKIPDAIVNVIDPIWNIGDVMNHRSRLYFSATAQDTSGNQLIRGVFSIIVSPSILGEVAAGITMESQGSDGLIPEAGSLSNAILLNNEPSSVGQDSYYSAYSTGASTGIIDFNNTTLWSGGEPVIETDIIPIGTILDKKTLGQIHFKLDRPMTSGDSISLYWRPSLSASYTLIGTTTTTQLSDYFPSNVTQSQWAQFKVTFSAGGTSFIPLREIRIQMQ